MVQLGLAVKEQGRFENPDLGQQNPQADAGKTGRMDLARPHFADHVEFIAAYPTGQDLKVHRTAGLPDRFIGKTMHRFGPGASLWSYQGDLDSGLGNDRYGGRQKPGRNGGSRFH